MLSLSRKYKRASSFQLEVLIRENEELREGHLDRLAIAAPIPAPGGLHLPPSNPMNAELLAEMHERLDILMDENGLLVEQKAVLSSDLDRLSQRLQKADQEIGELTSLLSQAAQERQALKAALSATERDREQAAQTALSTGEQLGRVEAEAEQLAEQLAVTQKRVRETEAALNDLRRQVGSPLLAR